jgi:hypothetical protein
MNTSSESNQNSSRLTSSDFIDANFSMIRARMAVAISADLHTLSVDVAKKVKYHPKVEFNTGLLELNFDRHRTLNLIVLSMRYLVDDEMWCNSLGSPYFSHWFGIDAVLRMYESKRWGTRDQSQIEELSDEIHAAQVALTLRGQHEMAVDIYRLAGVLNIWASSKVTVGSDFLENLPKEHGRFRILRYLRDLLMEDKIPTQGAIGEHLSHVDPSLLSRWLTGMHVKSVVPRASNAGRKEGEGIFTIRGNSKSSSASTNRTFNSDYKKLKPTHLNFTHDPRAVMEDCQIREIKEKLGMIYHFLILAFGMNELENHEDIKEFRKKLGEWGLSLSGCSLLEGDIF